MIQPWPKAVDFDRKVVDEFDFHVEIVKALRGIRADKNIPFKQEMDAFIRFNSKAKKLSFAESVRKLVNLKRFEVTEQKIEMAAVAMVQTEEIFVPLHGSIDLETEIKKLEAELAYTQGFLESVMKKLGNEKFVNSAPEKVVEAERKKKLDAETRIAALKEQLSALRK